MPVALSTRWKQNVFPAIAFTIPLVTQPFDLLHVRNLSGIALRSVVNSGSNFLFHSEQSGWSISHDAIELALA